MANEKIRYTGIDLAEEVGHEAGESARVQDAPAAVAPLQAAPASREEANASQWEATTDIEDVMAYEQKLKAILVEEYGNAWPNVRVELVTGGEIQSELEEVWEGAIDEVRKVFANKQAIRVGVKLLLFLTARYMKRKFSKPMWSYYGMPRSLTVWAVSVGSHMNLPTPANEAPYDQGYASLMADMETQAVHEKAMVVTDKAMAAVERRRAELPEARAGKAKTEEPRPAMGAQPLARHIPMSSEPLGPSLSASKWAPRSQKTVAGQSCSAGPRAEANTSGNAQPDKNTEKGGTGNPDGRQVASDGYNTNLPDVGTPEDIESIFGALKNIRPEQLDAQLEHPVRSCHNAGDTLALIDSSYSRPDAPGIRKHHQGGLDVRNTSGSGSTSRFIGQIGPLTVARIETEEDLWATYLHMLATRPRGTVSTTVTFSHNTATKGSKAIRTTFTEENTTNGSANNFGQGGFAKGKRRSQSKSASTAHSSKTGIAKGDSRGQSRGRSRTSKPRKERTTRSKGRVNLDEDIQEDDLEMSEAQDPWDKRPKSGRGSKTYDPSGFQLNRELPAGMSRNWGPDAESGSSVRRPFQWVTERNQHLAKVQELRSKPVLTPEEERTLMATFKKLHDLEKEPVRP